MSTITKREWTTARGEQRSAWVVRYADQDKKWRLKSFALKSEAKDWLTKAAHEISERRHVPESTAPTIGTAAESWIRRGEADQLERSTLRQRRQHVDLHILPLLGRDTKLTKLDLDAFRDELLRTRSRALAKKVMTTLKGILKHAKMAHLAADLDRIKTDGRHEKRLEVGRDIPSPAEVNALLKGSTGYLRALLALAVFCGLRMSEARALRWQDVDLKGKQLHVRQRADKWCAIGALKSKTSYRSVPMSPFVVNTLKEWKLACPKGELALVLPNGRGKVESLPNIWNRHLAPLQVAAGIVGAKSKPKYGAHSLRHFFASWLIDQGFNVKKVQTYLGHSSPVVTLTIYAHLIKGEDDHEKFAAGEVALVS